MALSAAGSRRAFAALAALLVAFVAGCSEPPVARARATGGDIVLLSGDSLADAAALAATLDGIAAGTGVVGPSRFALRSRPRAAPEELVDLLDDVGPARAIVAIIGDLGALEGIDPNEDLRVERRISSREIDLPALADAIGEQRDAVERLGARFVLATAPLGLQGRIEVPELVQLAAWLRGHAAAQEIPLLDLANHFARLEPVPLFGDGISRLDPFGQDEVVRALWTALLDPDGPLPAVSAAERAARVEHRALEAWARGDDALARQLTDAALARAPDDLAGAVRQACLVGIGPDGGQAGPRRWAALDVTGSIPDVPGLALCLALSGRDVGAAACADPVERGLVEIVELLREGRTDDALARAATLTTTQPQRLAAWICAEFTDRATGRPTNFTAAVLGMTAYRTGLPSAARMQGLERDWPARLAALPALIMRARPELALRPSGPVLEGARREARWGRPKTALRNLDTFLAHGRAPEAWHAERARLADLLR